MDRRHTPICGVEEDSMKLLFIGGTGNISRACTDKAIEKGWDVFHLNRGNRPEEVRPEVTTLRGDVNDAASVKALLGSRSFDAVVDWVAYSAKDVRRDIDVFSGRTGQYVFISTASAYLKPPRSLPVTESTPLANPFWQYSRDKIEGEIALREAADKSGFPFTVVRPSHTYGDGWIPTPFGSAEFTVAQRMLDGKEVVVPGDGQSIWTLTHNSDFAKGFVGLLGNSRALGEAFHITSDELQTWDNVHHAIADALGVKAKIVHIPSDRIAAKYPDWTGNLLGDKSNSAIFDNTKIKRFVPDFVCETPFAVGIRKSVAWLEKHPGKKVINPTTNERLDELVRTCR